MHPGALLFEAEMFVVEWDPESVRPWRGGKVEKALLESFRAAGGDAIRKARTDASRKIRSRKKLKARLLYDRLFVSYPPIGASLATMSWHLKPSVMAMPLTEYPHQQLWKTAKTKTGEVRRDDDGNKIKKPAGVRIQVNRGIPKILRHAFILKLKSGHQGIFQRRNKEDRLPVDKLFSSRVSDVASDDNFMPSLRESAQEELQATFARVFAIKLAKL